MRPSVSYRRYVVGVLFVFMLLHETDRLLIGPLTPDIMATFHITMTQMGAVSTGALIVGAVLYPVWGYAYDRFSRRNCSRWRRSSGGPRPGSAQRHPPTRSFWPRVRPPASTTRAIRGSLALCPITSAQGARQGLRAPATDAAAGLYHRHGSGADSDCNSRLAGCLLSDRWIRAGVGGADLLQP